MYIYLCVGIRNEIHQSMSGRVMSVKTGQIFQKNDCQRTRYASAMRKKYPKH